MLPAFSVVIPCFNEAARIGDTIRATLDYLLQISPESELIEVNDGSTDATSTIARQVLTTARIETRLLENFPNRGKGAALKTGFAWAFEQGYDGVVTLDADGQHLPQEIPKFLDCRNKTSGDLIIGGRAHLFGQMLPRRRMANRFSAWSIAFASGVDITDAQSGYRFYSMRMLRTMRLRSNGFAMESEVIVRAGRGGFKVLTTPIDLGFVDGISTSHYKPLKDTVTIAAVVFRTLIECLVRRDGGRS
jgi:glycosyltransferase involved in cell wall biosynthesis